MSHKYKHAVSFLFLLSLSPVWAGALEPELQIIPKPVHLQREPGVFLVSASTVIVSDPRTNPQALLLRDAISSLTGLDLRVALESKGPAIELLISPLSGSRPEGYTLRVRTGQVLVEAADLGGLVAGIQTIAQLLSAGVTPDGRRTLPCLTVNDYPRFPWRGLMLDCSRTFQSLDYIRKTIDRMSLYKMNVLHLHLTDDQGWRLEIRKYPDLTNKGAKFPTKYREPAAHEGFYSQAEMKSLIGYAAARNVTIVPEIEMPGHSLAALSCHPHLSCSGGPFEIFPFFQGPNITKDILCAGNEETFQFIEDFLAEVAALFPSRFVHVGGDEAPKDAWKKCPKCQRRIKQEGLRNEEELQSWFIRRAEAILQKHKKRLIGWDEILEGGLAPNAAVMSWRGTSGGIAAAKAGHDIVMSPTSHCYFDYTYEQIDSRRAYSFEPVPTELNADQAKHILGLQANFWSHIDREPEKVDRQIFPRLLAIAERGWSPKGTTDWTNFSARLGLHLRQLERLGVRYNKQEELVSRTSDSIARRAQLVQETSGELPHSAANEALLLYRGVSASTGSGGSNRPPE